MEQKVCFNGHRLAELREQKGLSRAQLSAAAIAGGVKKMSENSILHHERGDSEPGAMAFAFYVHFFDVKQSDLITVLKGETRRIPAFP